MLHRRTKTPEDQALLALIQRSAQAIAEKAVARDLGLGRSPFPQTLLDTIGRFLRSDAMRAEMASEFVVIPASTVYDRFVDWLDPQGQDPPGPHAFGRALNASPWVTRTTGKGGRRYQATAALRALWEATDKGAPTASWACSNAIVSLGPLRLAPGAPVDAAVAADLNGQPFEVWVKAEAQGFYLERAAEALGGWRSADARTRAKPQGAEEAPVVFCLVTSFPLPAPDQRLFVERGVSLVYLPPAEVLEACEP